MFQHRSFAAAVLALTFFTMSAPVHADSVLLNNLDQTSNGNSPGAFVGQSFIAGTANETLFGARMQLDPTSPPDSGIALEVEGRNFDGSVGTTLFSDFTSSYDTTSGLVTFTANSSFQLTAGTGYWLVLSDLTAGGVTWDFTASNVYQSEFGYGLPSFSTSMISTADNGTGSPMYFDPSDGPQLFELIAPTPASVPEPSSWMLLSFPVAIAVLMLMFKGARNGRPVKAM